jgi:hypothetical protein
MQIQIAFYIADKGTWLDKLIAWWTASKYSHVELIVDGMWYSTSPREGEVRKKDIPFYKDHWDVYDIEVDMTYLQEFFILTVGKKYDWKALIFTQVLPLGREDRQKFFCSEWVATALRISDGYKYSPEGLYRALLQTGRIEE